MIYFIRHGESEANFKRLFAGQRENSLLTEKGRQQAKIEADTLKQLDVKISAIISSPLQRALDTAEIIADIIQYTGEISIDPRISEYDMGSLTGTPNHPKISAQELISAEGAENPQVFYDRVMSFIEEWGKAEQDILMVSHAGVGRMIEIIKQKGNPELFYDIPAHQNALLVKLDWVGENLYINND